MGREDRQDNRRASAARRRAESHNTGFETTVLRIPEGVSFYDWKPGIHNISIIPYVVKVGKENIKGGGNPFAEKGELYFERTYFVYQRIGPNEKKFVCSSKTFEKPDFIQEWRQQESRKQGVSKDELAYIKSLNPKERQLFFVFNHKEEEKGLQILDLSFHAFGKQLDSRIKNSERELGWDLFYFSDDDGRMLRVTVEEQSAGASGSWNVTTAIDFVRRVRPLPDKIVNHGHDLDGMLIEIPYDKLKNEFLAIDPGKSEKKEEDSKSGTVAASEPVKGEKKEETPRDLPQEAPAKTKVRTAEEAGFKLHDKVVYRGKAGYYIAKISGDGTSLVLMNDVTDDIVKPVGVDEIVKETAKAETPKAETPKAETPKAETPKAETPKAGSKDDNWDEGWG